MMNVTNATTTSTTSTTTTTTTTSTPTTTPSSSASNVSEVLYRSVGSNEKPNYSTDCNTIPPNTKYLKLVMGAAIDYFRPIQGKTYCEMLGSYKLHQWSSDGSNWVIPNYYY